MYQAYWGLTRAPFSSAAAAQALAASPVHAEALARLDFLRDSRSLLGLLLGPAGSGKSAVLAHFAQRAARSGTAVALIPAAAAEEPHVLDRLAADLRAEGDHKPGALWSRVTERLAEMRLEGLTAVVLLDDLDRAAPSVLCLVQRLLAVPAAPLTIVATARPQSVERLGPCLLEQSALRIDLPPWNEDETRQYLQTSLANAGRAQPAFNDAALQRLFELSGGAPRKVNQLAELALLAGAGQRLPQIDADTIEAVQEELSVGG
jgi:general secretion pathway protein A